MNLFVVNSNYINLFVVNSALRRIIGKRSLVITRSSFPSLGKYGGHWTGDVYSTWDDLSYSVPGITEECRVSAALVHFVSSLPSIVTSSQR
jgi:hypothetical protein